MCKHSFKPCSYVQALFKPCSYVKAIFQALFLCLSIFKPLIMCSKAWEDVRIKTFLFFILSFFIFNSIMYCSSTIAHSSSCQSFHCCSSLSYVL
ncbi:hypothetical protein PPACK8108_LOCUS8548 [Phakopsora pachyrhizi]|uniref:Uncharacterized protein n=1 Tax=Phakopsora pachyrhizi TaxID=170000 RepID=A0AAV0AWW5_PHAPC|nr:hypothetical protein PPACK8108_LOCUS8548 [Phakopsora pachyrhizi]